MHIVHLPLFTLAFTALFGGFCSLSADVELSDLSYTIEDSKVTITDCDQSASGALNLQGMFEPASVTAIADSAFRNCSQITSAVIPEGVESIGDHAFYYCSNMESISLPDSLVTIGMVAFGRTGLTAITVPGSVQTIEREVFFDCAALLTVTFEEGMQVLGEQAFLACYLLESVYLPSTLTSFVAPRYSANANNYLFGSFSHTPKLETIEVAPGGSVYASSGGAIYSADYSTLLRVPTGYTGTFTIHDATTSVSYYAFEECALITEIACGAAFLGLSGETLLSCDQMTAFSVAAGNTSLKAVNDVLYSFDGTELVAYPYAKTGAYVVEDGATAIHAYAFHYNQGLTSITTPDSLQSIGEYAFYRSTSLLTADIQGVLTSLPENSFASCFNLSQVTLAHSIVNISSSAFSGCMSLEIFNSAPLMTIESRAFTACNSLTPIDLAEGLTEIGEASFSGAGLTEIDFPSTLEVIEDEAFYSSDLTSLDFPDGLLSIGEEAFSECDSLYSVKIPGSVTYIGPYAFYDSDTIRYIELGEGIQTLNKEAFADCIALEYILLPSTLTTIEGCVFCGSEELKGILFQGNVPASVESDIFDSTHADLTIYYYSGATGWGTDLMGIPTQAIASWQYPAATWMMSYGYAPDQDAGIDTNSDGVSLLMEYALGLSPEDQNANAMPQIALGDTTAELAYYAGASGVYYQVQVSYDLTLDDWTDIGVTQGPTDAQSIRTASIGLGVDAAFLRLTVEVGER